MTADELIAFEDRIKAAWEAGDLPFLVHLCGGNEEQLLSVFEDIAPGDWVFASHRSHYHALLAGVSPEKVEAEIHAGRSMFIFDAAKRFYTSAILAGACGIAAGAALAVKRRGESSRVWCFLGDGAEENGHLYEAALFVEANDLPCTFVIEDNGMQVDTPIADRRGRTWSTASPLKSFFCVRRYKYARRYPHAGSGCAHKIQFKPEPIERFLKG